MKTKKFFAMIIASIVVMSVMAVGVSAATAEYSGNCGDGHLCTGKLTYISTRGDATTGCRQYHTAWVQVSGTYVQNGNYIQIQSNPSSHESSASAYVVAPSGCSFITVTSTHKGCVGCCTSAWQRTITLP
jgi:hypothetical protein